MRDPLSELLRTTGVQGALIRRAQLGERFGVRAGDQPRPVFHVVVRGQAWIGLDDAPDPRPLEPGDVAVFPRGAAHRIVDTPGRTCRDVGAHPVDRGRGRLAVMHDETPTHRLDLLCGTFRLGPPAGRWLLDPLPELVVVRGAGSASSYVQATLALLDDELAHDGAGTELIRDRLVEVLVLQILRRWSLALPPGSTGWMAGLADAQLGPVLAAVHDEPAADWTLERMARAAGMSRTRFAHHFRETMGMAPATWVTEWKIAIARKSLSDGADVTTAAQRAGYASEASFSRAFKRVVGQPPAAWRASSLRAGLAG